MSKRILLIAAALAAAWLAWDHFGPRTPHPWTDAQIALLNSMSLSALDELPPDRSNAVADSAAAADFGHRLFFDTRLSANGNVSCYTCHQPERRFTDGLAKGRGIGLSQRNTRSIVGTAYSPWQYWDGRRDSQWAQALTPLEDPAEHGISRVRLVQIIAHDEDYRQRYQRLFGSLPDFSDTTRYPPQATPLGEQSARDAWKNMQAGDRQVVNTVFSNIGKVIAAYERKLLPGPSRFDQYVEELQATDTRPDSLQKHEILGLQLFIDEARCTECHNGPLLTNHEFHNTGLLSFPGDLPDRGRKNGVRQVLTDPFNCLGEFSDDAEHHCEELDFVRTGQELVGAMRTPSLRNLAGTEPYGHKGQQATLAEVLDQYNRSPNAMIGHNEAEFPLGLSDRELGWLQAFLESLDAPIAADEKWLRPPTPPPR